MADFTTSGMSSGISATKMSTAEPKKAFAQKVGSLIPSKKVKAQPVSSITGVAPTVVKGAGGGKAKAVAKGVSPTVISEPKKAFITKFGETLGKGGISYGYQPPAKKEEAGFLSFGEYIKTPSEAFKRQAELQKQPWTTQAYEYGMGAVESVAEIPSYFVYGAEKVGLTKALSDVGKTTAGQRFLMARTSFGKTYGAHITPPSEIREFYAPVSEYMPYSLGEPTKRRATTERLAGEVALTLGGGAVLGGVLGVAGAYAPATYKISKFVIPTSKIMQVGVGGAGLGLTGLYGAGRYGELTGAGKTPSQAISRIAGELTIAGGLFKAGVGLGKYAVSPLAKPTAYGRLVKGAYTPMEYARRPFAYQRGEWGAKYTTTSVEKGVAQGIKFTKTKGFSEGTLKEYTKSINLATKEFSQVSIKRTPYGTITGTYRQAGTFIRPVEPYQTLTKTGLETYQIVGKKGISYGIRPSYELTTISAKKAPISFLEVKAVSPKAVSYYSRMVAPEGIKTAYITSAYKYKLPLGVKLGAVSKAEVSTAIPKDYFTITSAEGLGIRATGYYAEAGGKGRLQYIKGLGGERYVSFKPSLRYATTTKLTTAMRSSEIYQGIKLTAPKVKTAISTSLEKAYYKYAPKTLIYKPTGLGKYAVKPYEARPITKEYAPKLTFELGGKGAKQYQIQTQLEVTDVYPSLTAQRIYPTAITREAVWPLLTAQREAVWPQATKYKQREAVWPAQYKVAQRELVYPQAQLQLEKVYPQAQLTAVWPQAQLQLVYPQAQLQLEKVYPQLQISETYPFKRELQPPEVPPTYFPTYYTPPEFYMPVGFGGFGGWGGYGVSRKIKGHLLSFPKVEMKILKRMKV